MFTGIVKSLAEVESISKIRSRKKSADTKLRINMGKKIKRNLNIGDSISINGVCLTAIRISRTVDFEMIDETINSTCLGLLKVGDRVNIEESLRIGDRLEGHLLLGHVDGTGIIKKIIRSSKETLFWIKIEDRKLLPFVVSKGPIAIDGVSLTIIEIKDEWNEVSVALVPHTLAVTTLGIKSVGDKVNIETDIIGKYISRHLTMK